MLMAGNAVEYSVLPMPVREDIAANLIVNSDFLSSQRWTEIALAELLSDLIEPIMVSVSQFSVIDLRRQVVRRSYSDFAVRRLHARLIVVGELDPVIVDGDRFIDGRHRVEAYARAGRSTIPTVDISPLLRIDWERWMNGQVRCG